MHSIFQDWSYNHGNRRSQLVLLLFRIAQCFHHFPSQLRWIGFPFFTFYEIVVVWIFGIELNYKAKVGPGLRLFHGVATVLHESVVMGKHCTLRHSTTIGMRRLGEGAPIIGDEVDIGCHSVIMGDIRIGHGAVIGAGSVVLHDVPDHGMVVGNPAQLLDKKRKPPKDEGDKRVDSTRLT